jgi:hypothetical protein
MQGELWMIGSHKIMEVLTVYEIKIITTINVLIVERWIAEGLTAVNITSYSAIRYYQLKLDSPALFRSTRVSDTIIKFRF